MIKKTRAQEREREREKQGRTSIIRFVQHKSWNNGLRKALNSERTVGNRVESRDLAATEIPRLELKERSGAKIARYFPLIKLPLSARFPSEEAT